MGLVWSAAPLTKHFYCLLFISRDLLSGRYPAPLMTGSVHQTLIPTCVQWCTTSQRMKQSWKNGSDTWGRRLRTGTMSSGASRILPSARFNYFFLSHRKCFRACKLCDYLSTVKILWDLNSREIKRWVILCSYNLQFWLGLGLGSSLLMDSAVQSHCHAETKFLFSPADGSTTPQSCQIKTCIHFLHAYTNLF